MLFLINLRKNFFNLLVLSFLATILIVVPPLIGARYNLFYPSLEVSVQAQTPNSSEVEPTPAATEAQQQQKNQPAKNASEEEDKKEEKLEPFKMTMGAIGGLVLFLYGVTRMAEGLEAIAGDRMKEIIGHFTTNRYAGLATGAAATTLLDSSSVTIIITIAMVSAGLLTFVQSLGVVLGSNIGTTVGAQIIAFKINEYAPIVMFIGFLLTFIGKTDRLKNIGLVLLGFGLLFFGLDQIESAMEPFETYQPFLKLMENLGDKPLLGAGIGALFTILVQSSSATVAIIVTLASQGLISLPTGIALMLGAEVGTCADTLVATIGRERPAVRTGIFHLLFNLTTATLGILFASQLAALAQWLSSLFGAGEDVARQIANAQLIFNVLGVMLVIGFLPLITKGLEKVIPKGKDETDSAFDRNSRADLESR